MEDLSLKPIEFQQRVEACKALYLEYQGRHHDEIQREMREMGHASFNRRVLYTRNQRGTTTPGWPERFGWNGEITNDKLRISNSYGPASNIRNSKFEIRAAKLAIS